MTLNQAAGVIRGMPTATGSFSFTIRATNNIQTIEVDLIIEIRQPNQPTTGQHQRSRLLGWFSQWYSAYDFDGLVFVFLIRITCAIVKKTLFFDNT